MQRKYLLFSLFLISLFATLNTQRVNSEIPKPPSGSTGDPLTGKTCAQAGCHPSPALAVANNLTLNIGTGNPTTPLNSSFQYTPGTQYNIAFSINSATGRYGFQMSALTGSNAQAGTFAVTTTTTTQVSTAGAFQYVGHKNANATKNWVYKWTAPASNVGPVTFYYAFNTGDANNQAAGDVIYNGSVTIQPGNGYNVSLGAAQTVCPDSVVTLVPVITGGTAPYTYTWGNTGNTLSCNNCQNPTATLTQNSVYTVTVTDAASATASGSVSINVNSPLIQITPSGPTVFCQGNTVTLQANAGQQGYVWSNGATTSSISVTQSGTYAVTVTTIGGCTFTDSEVVTVNTPAISNYQILANGPTNFCTGSSVILDAGNGLTSYNWNTGSTSATITVSQSGTYAVTAVGPDGCTYTDNETVTVGSAFSGQQICMVSVDINTGKNIVVWEKTTGFGIDSFNVYRETGIVNQYQLIRQQAFGNFSTYEDVQSNPQQSANRYVITTVDNCGESAYSTPHKTVHLTSNLGINNEVNLIWNAYEGITYPSFNIYRGPNQSNLTQIAQVPAGTLSFTDVQPPAPPLYYQVEVVNPLGCVPTAKTDGYASSLSNVVQINIQSTNTLSGQNIQVYAVYSGALNQNVIRWSGLDKAPQKVAIYNLTGQVVFETSTIQAGEVSLPQQLNGGIYVAAVFIGDKIFRNKVFLK